MATSAKREHERESAPPTSSKSPTEIKTKDEDVKQLIDHREKPPLQSVGRSTLKQETPQPPCIKKEEEELCITQEGECLLGREEADYTKFPLTVVSVKIEDDEEKPQADNFLAPLSDSETEDEVDEPLSSDADCEGDMRTHTDNKHSECSKNKRDIQLLIRHSEEVSPQLGGSSTLKQETPQPPHIKKEEEELWITQEEECLLGREEADYTKLPLTVVSVKTVDDEEKPQVDNLLAPLSDSEAEDEVEEPLSSNTGCEGDMRTHTDKQFDGSKKKRGKTCLSCSVCAKNFKRKSLLAEHMRTHTGEKPFQCSVCGKTFSQKSSMTQHMRMHTGEKPFHCSVCGESFPRNSYLTSHMRTHTGEKSFNCSICLKSFTTKNSLTQHMRIHAGEYPFNCTVCGKSFFVKGNLTQHMKTHTGIKPFICSICGHSFVYRQSFTRHIMTHTADKRFSCSVCCKRFHQNSDAVRHTRTHKVE
ncbi:zinc finger protein 2-like isoform X1 [Entelurus aequoreus]|uniref:zinc finger protein 2-like isoform X1 n=1 Tax=Entelurus aequoreus TaxID=161455 RepID=UPI002B1E5658|nr:zinc finger protein 2-like isoform X1 [Entelurus aequoreus]